MLNKTLGPLPNLLRNLLRTLLRTVTIAASLASMSVHAQYQDPIDLPAQKIKSARNSLILDITSAGNRLVAVGERGHILYSNDQGSSWSQAEVESRAHLNAVTFVDAEKGWAVGEDQVILHTSDGGKSWMRQYDDRDAEQKGPLLEVYFRNNREGFAIGVFNKLLHTDNGGQSWHPWQEHIDNIDEWHLFAIAAPQPDHLYIASEMGLIFRSLDGGENFEPLQSDHDGSFHGILARQGDDGADQLVLFGVGGILYTSTDNGESWNLIETGTETGLAGGTWMEDGSALIVGAEGLMLKLDARLQRVQLTSNDNGLPLNAAITNDANDATLVGLGGIQSVKLNQLLGLR